MKTVASADILSLQPTYIPLFQKPKCCAVACLQMILYRNGFGLHDQEDLAIQFGVRIESDDRHAFRENMQLMTQFNLDEGISTLNSVGMINALFRNSGILLSATAHLHSNFGSLKDLVAENLSKNNDIWIEYHSNEIHALDKNSNRIHDAVIESYDAKSDSAVIIDPSPRRRQRISVGMRALTESMSDKYGKELGLLLIQKQKTTP